MSEGPSRDAGRGEGYIPLPPTTALDRRPNSPLQFPLEGESVDVRASPPKLYPPSAHLVEPDSARSPELRAGSRSREEGLQLFWREDPARPWPVNADMPGTDADRLVLAGR